MRMIVMILTLSLLLPGCLAAAGDQSKAATETTSAESRWVLAAGTALKAEAAAAAADILLLDVGTKVTVLENAGRWLKVETVTRESGWVFAGRLSTEPPVTEVESSDGLFAATASQSQIDIAQADSARSIRGLSAETENYAKERGTPQEYRKALDQILARQVSKEEVAAFMRAGNLGEYAR